MSAPRSRSQKLEEILGRALETTPPARVAFLNEACRGDETLRREVEALLAQESEDRAQFPGRGRAEMPRWIAHFEVAGKLGEGGMGAVYRAKDLVLGREVAIKVLPAAVADDPDRIARFTREAKALAALNHPNIAAIYGVEGQAIVMELVDGEDLKGPLPVETALEYGTQIAAALEAAHRKGIVHRDLKPANVKVTSEGMVKVLDFGLAKAVEGAAGTDLATATMQATEVGAVVGTPAYMAPEQARGETADRLADVWAFGAVLFEMLFRVLRGTSETGAGAVNGWQGVQWVANFARRCIRCGRCGC